LEIHIQINPIKIDRKGLRGEALVVTLQDIASLGTKDLIANDYKWQVKDRVHQDDFFPTTQSLGDQARSYSESDFQEFDSQVVMNIKKEWELALDSLGELLCVVNSETRIVRANRAIEKWKLAKVTAVKGKKFHDLMHFGCTDPNCYLDDFNASILEVIVSGKSAELLIYDSFLKKYLKYQINKIHTDVILESDFVVISVNNIDLINASSSTLDSLTKTLNKKIDEKMPLVNINKKLNVQIDKLNQAEASLKMSQRAYFNLLDKMSEGVVVQDNQSRIVYVNREFSRMLGLSKALLVGKNVSDFVLDHDLSPSAFDLNSLLNKRGLIVRLKSSKGRIFWVKVSVRNLINELTQSHSQSLVITDIDDYVQSQQKLIAADDQLRLLSQKVLNAQELERKRIAFELHDGLGQTLSAVKFYVENTINKLALDSKVPGNGLDLVVSKLQGAVEEVRRISMDIRPSILDDIGILATLRWFSREVSLLYPSIKFTFDAVDLREDQIGDLQKTQIFRIVQEAVNNACKYSECNRVLIVLSREGRFISLSIKDNGKGFNYKAMSEPSKNNASLGLVSMRERAENSDGSFELRSSKRDGTMILCKWPHLEELT
jgi:PAS domain S-box-containing protein